MSLLQTLTPNKRARLEVYVKELDRWRSLTNLISAKSFTYIWGKHIEVALGLQLLHPDARVIFDIGSGAGLPGIVLGIVLQELPGAQIHCVEKDGRKCAFLRSVAERLQLPMKIYNARLQSLDPNRFGKIDIVTAQAFSSVKNILDLTDGFLTEGALLALPRGRSGLTEVDEIDVSRYKVDVNPNPGSPEGVVLSIRMRDKTL